MTEDVVSNIAPPVITCPSCEGMLPSELGLVTCVLCSVQVRVEHEPTRRAWVKEKVACPSCNSVLVAGADNRPARLRCGSCGDSFTLLRARPKVDIHCPSCEAHLRSPTPAWRPYCGLPEVHEHNPNSVLTGFGSGM